MNDGDITIVQARTSEELAEVRRLFLEYAADLGWDLDSTSRFAREIDDLPGPYAPPDGALLIARIGGEMAGVLGLEPVPADVRAPVPGAECFGELKRLYVRPKWRRLGVARALMRHAEAEACARGYEALVLTTSAQLMPLAQSLYDSLGYCPTEPYRTDFPWPDLRWLKLDL